MNFGMVEPTQWPFSELALGAWLGIGILFCVYNFFVGLVLRQRWLSFIILPGTVFILVEYAYFGRFNPPLPFGLEKSAFLSYLGCLVIPPTIAASATFTRQFLQLRRAVPKVDQALRRISYASFVPLLGLPFVPLDWVSAAMFAVVIGGAGIATYAHWCIWQAGGTDMRLLGGSWLLMGPALIAWFGRNLGVFEGGAVITATYLIGFGGNLIILSIASIARLRALNEEVIGQLRSAQRKSVAARRLERQLRDEIQQRSQRLDAEKARADQEYESKRAFMSLISHDLRGPLANATQALDQILSNESDVNKKDQRQLLDRVQETLGRQLGLVDRLLDLDSLSQPTSGEKIYPIDFHQLVEERVREWQTLANEQQISLINQSNQTTPLYGDLLLIKTLLDTLIANALRHTPSGGQIIIRHAISSDHAFEVNNTHPGLSAEQQQRIKAATSTVTHTQERPPDTAHASYIPDLGSGRGMGLRLARSLINAQGGALEYGFNDPWVVFRVDLPTRLPLILLVDDQMIQLREMRKRIASFNLGCEIVEATSVDDAINLIDRRSPALVISDVRMPHRDGFELLAAIRNNNQSEEIPVVLASATESCIEAQALQDQALRAGADAYLNKPMPQAELKRLIHGVTHPNYSGINA